MYIYRAVRSRGQSLQEGANHLRVLQYPATSSRTYTEGEHPTPGLVVPLNVRGQGLQWTQLHLCTQLECSIPWGKGFWFPYRILAI